MMEFSTRRESSDNIRGMESGSRGGRESSVNMLLGDSCQRGGR